MAPASLMANEIVVPDPTATKAANDAFEELTKAFGPHPISTSELHFRVGGMDSKLREVEVPTYVVQLVADVLGEVARGNVVTVAAIEREVTTQQAADILNVSRPYVVKLLDERRIPHRRVGNRRKVLLADVLEYKRQDDAFRREVADELTREAEDLGLDY
jgi:excisionase family DNA binding protein